MSGPDVLIVAQYMSASDGSNSRFAELARMVAARLGRVEVVTSAFSHRVKAPHDKRLTPSPACQMVYISEPGYAKNISLRRLYSHRVLAHNVAEYLETRRKPDLIYCAVPSLSVAFAVMKYAKRKNSRLILDVQDLWPEAFHMVSPNRRLSQILLSPLKRQADSIYRSADAVVTVSKTYSARVASARGSGDDVHTVYLGTDLNRFDRFAESERIGKPKDEIWLGYVGTLGASYDLPMVFEALHRARLLGLTNIKLLVMGTGPHETDFKRRAEALGVDATFTGVLEYPRMASMLRHCDLAVNPIRSGSAASVTNKVCDYAAAGLPVLNTQESPEYRNLLADFGAGISCANDAPNELTQAIVRLSRDDELRLTMGRNSRRLAEAYFDRSKTYGEIVDLMLELSA